MAVGFCAEAVSAPKGVGKEAEPCFAGVLGDMGQPPG